ncbi:DUF4214 domain-containing protein [Mesorhizobium sp. CAU 1741]|uniref:DUF4214 domain-containing protein n=1 Tax=Mesorhizobium sp. CAU 1741 TaxID=3140366 RepID=UPI00325B490F
MTYSFAEVQADYDSSARPGFAGYSEDHKVHVREGLALWARDTGLTFVEVPDAISGQIRFGMYDMSGELNADGNPLSGKASTPSPYFDLPMNENTRWGGDVWLNSGFYAGDSNEIAPGNRGYSILIHEIGHALGFKHPFQGDPTIDPDRDNGSYTIMAYDRPWSTVELGPIDLAAARLYYGQTSNEARFDAATQKVVISGDTNLILGTELSDRIEAGDGNDLILASGGSDEVFGGLGTDVFRILGPASGYAATVSGNTANVAGHQLFDVERIQFTDGILALDVEGVAGQAYRIYQAAFARTPDDAGLRYWIDAMDNGTDLAALGESFVGSAEFADLYAGIDSTDAYVNQLYRNILDRDGEPSGVAYWAEQIDSGALDMAQVLTGFSESPENVARVSPSIEDGIWLT